MTPPIRPEGFDAVGFVKEARRRGIAPQDINTVLRENGHGQYANELESAAKQSTGVGPALFEGAGWGLDKPILAGAGTVMQKLSGDSRPMKEIYQQLKADVDNRSGVYRSENPGTALAANLTGAVLSGKANPMLSLSKATPVIGKALPAAGTWTGRAIQSGANAGAQAGVSSIANTPQDLNTFEGWKNAALDAGANAALGFGFGTLASPVFETVGKMVPSRPVKAVGSAVDKVVNTGRNALADALEAADAKMAPKALPSAQTTTAVAPSPAKLSWLQRTAADVRPTASVEIDPGAARIISRLQAQGMTVADLEKMAEKADGTDILAELIGEKGLRDLDQMRILGNKAPDQIKTALRGRAMDEAGRWQAALEKFQGAPMRDAEAFGNEVIQKTKDQAKPLYDATQQTKVSPDDAKSLLAEIKDLKDDGIDVWKEVRLSDKTFPKKPTPDLTVGQVQRLRQAFDKRIDYGNNPLAPSLDKAAQGRLSDLRNMADDIAKRHGGADFVQADAIREEGFTAARAFASGEKALHAKTPEELQRLMQESGDPESFRQGLASARQAQVQKMRDGVGGGFQNPFAAATGSPMQREITKASLKNPADMAEVERLATAGERRMATLHKMGGSQSGERVADMAEQMGGAVNPGTVVQAVSNPQEAAGRGLSALWNGAQRRLLGNEMDAASKFMLAGAPGQMPLAEGLAKLKRAEPALDEEWRRQVINRGRVVGTTLSNLANRK